MKNFSMPKQVSPTLEIDELMRLKHSLEKNVSREVAESIIKEIPLSINSTPDIRAEWVEKLSAILENRFDKKTVKNIRQECYCNENGRLEDTANKIAVINGNHESNVLASERYKGYLDGLREAGLEIREELIYQGTYKQSYAYLAAKEIFQKQDQPTAVLTCNNSLGKGYLQAVREDGKTDSYTHVSLDKIEMLDLLGIPHNYIERDSYELGKRAAELLINRIAFPEKRIQNILLEAPLFRETF